MLHPTTYQRMTPACGLSMSGLKHLLSQQLFTDQQFVTVTCQTVALSPQTTYAE